MHGDLRGIRGTLLGCKRVSSAMAHISSVLVPRKTYSSEEANGKKAFRVIHVEDKLE
jgi:hypothetical protein